ncbi:MAG TPA: mechanosensitive ion channel family protein [Clostridiaceae bacterium]|nr:mechanosensitive ion channel family protein [Clostridiaceae bacterium]
MSGGNVIQNWLKTIRLFFQTGSYLIVGGKILKILIIAFVSKVIIQVGRNLIKRMFDKQISIIPHARIDERKNNTLKSLVQSIMTYVVYFIAILIILGELGVQTTSILATAGIGGLAIGFGAQNLVKDIITGFFILFEDQYAVGDFVTIGDISGTVMEIGLRVTKIRGFKGDINIIPNGQITRVTNFSRSNSLAIIDMNISYDTDVSEAVKIMEDTANKYAEGNQDIVEKPQVLGITEFGDSKITIRAIVRTLPLKHWGVERELRKLMKEAFNKNGIAMPLPVTVVIHNNKS